MVAKHCSGLVFSYDWSPGLCAIIDDAFPLMGRPEGHEYPLPGCDAGVGFGVGGAGVAIVAAAFGEGAVGGFGGDWTLGVGAVAVGTGVGGDVLGAAELAVAVVDVEEDAAELGLLGAGLCAEDGVRPVVGAEQALTVPTSRSPVATATAAGIPRRRSGRALGIWPRKPPTSAMTTRSAGAAWPRCSGCG